APARHVAPFDNALPTDFDSAPPTDFDNALSTDFDGALPTDSTALPVDFGNALPALRDCFGPLRGPRNDRLRSRRAAPNPGCRCAGAAKPDCQRQTPAVSAKPRLSLR